MPCPLPALLRLLLLLGHTRGRKAEGEGKSRVERMRALPLGKACQVTTTKRLAWGSHFSFSVPGAHASCLPHLPFTHLSDCNEVLEHRKKGASPGNAAKQEGRKAWWESSGGNMERRKLITCMVGGSLRCACLDE